MKIKTCILALITTTILSGCNPNNDQQINDNNEQPYIGPIASGVNITGDSLIGSTLTGHYTFTDPNYSPRSEGTSEYNWKVKGNDESIGNELTYLLTENEFDKNVYFCVTPEATSTKTEDEAEDEDEIEIVTGETKCSVATEKVTDPRGSKPEASNVTINNSEPTVGDTLTASYDYSDADGDLEATSQFVWKAGSEIIAAANQASLVLTKLQQDKTITFCVTPVSMDSDAFENYPTIGDQVCSAATAPTQALQGSAPVASNILVDGEHSVGAELTGSYQYADDDNDLEGASTLAWKRDNVAIAGKNAAIYTAQAEDIGTELTFCVTPFAQTGLPNEGSESCSAPINDIIQPVGDIPTITLKTVTSNNDINVAQVGDLLTGSYIYTPSASGAADQSISNWKADDVIIATASCTVGTDCDLTLSEEQLGKALTYCVTPKATDSPEGVEACSPAITVFGVKITGSLEFSKTLTAVIYGYQSPTYSWKVDTSDTEGPSNDNSRSEKATTASYTIGDSVLATLTNIDPDFDANSGNNNGIIDDADWDQAIRAGSVTSATENAAHYIGKDVELCITTAEKGEICLLASAQAKTDVTGGVYYDQADENKRAIEPTREVEFRGTVIYHRPLTKAEALLKADAGFGANLPIAHYSQTEMGIEWASFKLEHTDATTPGLSVCLNLYDTGTNWYLPASRGDSAYTIDAYTALGNAAPIADTGALLIKFANIFDPGTLAARTGVMGSFDSHTSPIFGWPVTGPAATLYWSATKPVADDTKANAVKFYDNGSSGNNTVTNGRFVSCARSAN